MAATWGHNPSWRPTFEDICTILTHPEFWIEGMDAAEFQMWQKESDAAEGQHPSVFVSPDWHLFCVTATRRGIFEKASH
jgi:hypothetical protein